MAEKKGGNVGKLLAAGAAAAAAGYYFYSSPNAKENRAVAAKWADDMKSNVVKQAKKLKKVERKTLVKVIDDSAKVAMAARNLDRKEVVRAAGELKTHWQKIVSEMNAAGKKSLKKAKKSIKKTVAKTKTKAKVAAKKRT